MNSIVEEMLILDKNVTFGRVIRKVKEQEG